MSNFKSQARSTPSTNPPTTAMADSPSTFKSIPLDEYLSDKKGSASLAAIIIGNAEGTRTPDGSKTKGFYGYKVPGSDKLHKGSFSYQVPSDQNEEADRKQLAAMRRMKEPYLQAAKKSGLDPNNTLLASAYFDSFNQSPSAAERFLTQMPYLKSHGITPESVIQARVSSWVDSKTRKRYVTSSGMPVGGGFVNIARKRAEQQQRVYAGEPDVVRIIHEDQARRVNAMVLALKKQNLASAPANIQPYTASNAANARNMAAGLQRTASVEARAGSGPKVSPAGSQSILESVWNWLWGTLQGDFNKDPSLSQIAVNTVLGFIPLVDQVLDVRDIIAGLKDIIEFYMEDDAAQARHESVLGIPYEVWLWLNIFIIAIGCIPEVGSAVKGVLKVLIECLVELSKKMGGLEARHLQELWGQLVKVLGGFGINEPRAATWLRQLPDKLTGWMSQATGKIKSALNAIQNLLSQAEEMALSRYAEWLLDKKSVQQLVDSIRRIKKAVQKTYQRLDTMKAEVNTWLRMQLGKLLGAQNRVSLPADGASPGKGRHVPWSGEKYIGDFDAKDAKRYDEIRKHPPDFHRMHKSTGISRLVLKRVYEHLFRTVHEVPLGPNKVARGYFSPDSDIADLWMNATRGKLSREEAERFRRLMAHEYVESKLMEQGLPYRSAHPKAWIEDTGLPTPEHYGAHDLAPVVAVSRPPFLHWEMLLGMKAPDFAFAADLGNLDELVKLILKKTRNWK